MEESRRRAYLDALGIPVWVPRTRGATAHAAAIPEVVEGRPGVAPYPSGTPLTPSPAGRAEPSDYRQSEGDGRDAGCVSSAVDAIEGLDWEALQARVRACTTCELHRTRTQTVFGVGNPAARLMVIGEAPGADEDRQGEPFVGRAGKLLDAMLHAIGLQRGDVYIANVLKCRPPGNRNPSLDEAARCEGFLRRQIGLVGPRLILSVGGIAARNLLGTDTPVGRLRGAVHEYGEDRVPVLVTYHPAYLLRQPEEKAKAWQDLQQAARLLRDAG
jgi:DNA polymerase